ncbi:carbohydrate-binding protein [Paenibacillus psychroresistens]|uniref:Carbohydrate-binding protein n=1 Tax=Paenibacillus psychroresistens TaxID=1778678 RepID=A0A6B8RND6_9BACL|nr:CBM35 domain-containing protein [Paenibacillus psychroresistens]QGQ97284.1 carbohydrate-binding protein [Paenibacillus psychroresistens]
MKASYTRKIKLCSLFIGLVLAQILLVSCDSSTPTNSPTVMPTLAATPSPVVRATPAAAPVQDGAVIYEAELAAISGGAAIATDHIDFTGTAFVAGYVDGNKGFAATQFTVDAEAAGDYDVILRYANGTGSAKTLSVYVNEALIEQISLDTVGSWDDWGTKVENFTLIAGSNAISYRFGESDSGNVNIDQISVSRSAGGPKATATPPPRLGGTYEAEAAVLSGGSEVTSDHTGFSGTGFVSGFSDANKAKAAIQFTVNVPIAGNYPASLRYTSALGTVQTLSLYVNEKLIKPLSFESMQDWETWGLVLETLALNAGDNTITYKYDAADSGNINLDNLNIGLLPQVTPKTTPKPTKLAIPNKTTAVYEAEAAFFSGGVQAASSLKGFSATGYLNSFTADGARAIFAVHSPAADKYLVSLKYSNDTGATKSLSIYVNGLKQLQTSLEATKNSSTWVAKVETLTLRNGYNTVSYQYDQGDSGAIQIDSISVANSSVGSARGANLPYIEYEAEKGVIGGGATILAKDRTYLTLASEASGRQAVKLAATGQFVQFTNKTAANSMVIRYSMPDAASGAEGITAPLSIYVNGVKQSVNLSSKYAWVYGDYPYNNVQKPETGHHFFDETHTLINVPAGATVKLQKDKTDTAEYYIIDFIDLEQVDAPYAMPDNYISIADAPYNAVGNGTTDNTKTIRDAIKDATAAGKGLWIPEGQFLINDRINVSNLTIRGAGPWYSSINGWNGKGGFIGKGDHIGMFDFAILGDVSYRNDGAFDAGIEGDFGTGSIVQNVWMEHVKVGLWIDSPTDGLYIGGVRVRDTFADGVNLHKGTKNTIFEQSNVRNTGDDNLAMWSEVTPTENNNFRFNTLQLPMLANNIGIYGGIDNKAEDNLAYDTVNVGAGININTDYNSMPFGGVTTLQRNTLVRTGSVGNNGIIVGAVWVNLPKAPISEPVIFTDILINDSTFNGISIYGQDIWTKGSFNNVTIEKTGAYGVQVSANAQGSADFSKVKVSGAKEGGLNTLADLFKITKLAGNSGW